MSNPDTPVLAGIHPSEPENSDSQVLPGTHHPPSYHSVPGLAQHSNCLGRVEVGSYFNISIHSIWVHAVCVRSATNSGQTTELHQQKKEDSKRRMKEEQKEETEGEKDEEDDEEGHSNSEDGHLHMESAEDTAVHDFTAQEASTTTTEDPSASAFQYDPIE